MTRCSSCGCAVVGAQDPSRAEARILAFILDQHAKTGLFPTYHAIKVAFRFRSLTAAAHQLRALHEKGWITIEKYRGITAAKRPT